MECDLQLNNRKAGTSRRLEHANDRIKFANERIKPSFWVEQQATWSHNMKGSILDVAALS